MAEGDVTQDIIIALRLKQEELERNAKRAERAVQNIERRYDPLARASQKLDRDTQNLAQALDRGAISADKHADLMNKVQAEYAETETRIRGTSQALVAQAAPQNALIGLATRHRASLQQIGYQVGDFAVQVGSGTSAMIAFSQQGSQLLGAFGAFGALAGAALAILAPLARSFFTAGDEAESAAKKLERLEDATDMVADAADDANQPIEDLRIKYGELADEIQRALKLQLEFAQAAANVTLQDAASAVVDEVGNLQGYLAALDQVRRSGPGNELAVRRAEAQFQERTGLTETQARQLQFRGEALRNVEGAGNKAEAAEALRDLLLDAQGGVGGEFGTGGKFDEAIEGLNKAIIAFAKLENPRAEDKLDEARDKERETQSRGRKVQTERNREAEKAQREAEKISREVERDQKRFGSEMERAIASALQARQRLTETIDQQNQSAELEARLLGKSASEAAMLRTEFQLLEQAKRDGIDINEQMVGSEQTYAEAIRDTAIAAGEYTEAQERRAAAEKRAEEQERLLIRAQEELQSGLADAILKGENFADTLARVAEMLAKAALQATLFGSGPFGKSDGGGGILGDIFGSLGGLLGGGPNSSAGLARAGAQILATRATGGPTQAGEPYLVNEATPRSEIFVPSQSGHILNQSQAMAALRARSPAASAGSGSGGIVRVIVEDGPHFGAMVRAEAKGVAVDVVQKQAPATERRAIEGAGRSLRATKTYGGF